MDTILYFVRHAESVYVEGQERSRGLSDTGKADAQTISGILRAEQIDCLISSPYERAIATIRPAADELAKEIRIEGDLKERSIGDFSPLSFTEAKRRVYEDFHFTFPKGESSLEAQNRAVNVINSILEINEGKKTAVGTHGDIMTLMLNHFDKNYNFDFWKSTSMPDVYKLIFREKSLLSIIRLWE